VKATHVELYGVLAPTALLPSCFVGNILDERVFDILGAQAVVAQAVVDRISAACACLFVARCACTDAGADILGRNKIATCCYSTKYRISSVDLVPFCFVLSHDLMWQEGSVSGIRFLQQRGGKREASLCSESSKCFRTQS